MNVAFTDRILILEFKGIPLVCFYNELNTDWELDPLTKVQEEAPDPNFAKKAETIIKAMDMLKVRAKSPRHETALEELNVTRDRN